MLKTQSTLGAKDTMDRLEAAARARGMTIFARIDHAAGAHAVGLTLLPTELLVFGDARVGTALMQAKQTMGLELPLKALVWQDDAGDVWIGHDDLHEVAARHELGAEPLVTKVAAGIVALVAQSIGID